MFPGQTVVAVRARGHLVWRRVRRKGALSHPSWSYQSLAELCGAGKVIHATGGSGALCTLPPHASDCERVEPLFLYFSSGFIGEVRGHHCHFLLTLRRESKLVHQMEGFLNPVD